VADRSLANYDHHIAAARVFYYYMKLHVEVCQPVINDAIGHTIDHTPWTFRR